MGFERPLASSENIVVKNLPFHSKKFCPVCESIMALPNFHQKLPLNHRFNKFVYIQFDHYS